MSLLVVCIAMICVKCMVTRSVSTVKYTPLSPAPQKPCSPKPACHLDIEIPPRHPVPLVDVPIHPQHDTHLFIQSLLSLVTIMLVTATCLLVSIVDCQRYLLHFKADDPKRRYSSPRARSLFPLEAGSVCTTAPNSAAVFFEFFILSDTGHW